MQSIGYNAADHYACIADLAGRGLVCTDAMRLLLGDVLGAGKFRTVFESAINKREVIKFANDVSINFTEFAVWQAVKNTKYAKWFAPISRISPQGHFLFMRRTRPLKPGDKLPKLVPNFAEDLHRGNVGFIGKQFVLHDYQFINRALDIAAMENRKLILKP